MRCLSVFLSRGLNNKGKHRAEKSQDSRRKPYRFRVRQTRLFDYKAEDKADYTSCAQLQYAAGGIRYRAMLPHTYAYC